VSFSSSISVVVKELQRFFSRQKEFFKAKYCQLEKSILFNWITYNPNQQSAIPVKENVHVKFISSSLFGGCCPFIDGSSDFCQASMLLR
jgi:hypothetical protein